MKLRLSIILALLFPALVLTAQPSLHNYFKGISHLELAEPDLAIESFQQSLQDGVKKSVVHLALGDIHQSKGNTRQAKEEFILAETYDPGIASFRLAILYAQEENPEKMYEYLNLHIKSTHSLTLSAIQSNQQFNPYKSSKEWIAFWSKAPISGNDLNLNEANYLISTKKYDDAIQFLTKLIEKRSNTAEAYFLRGKAYLFLNEFRFAAEDFSKAASIKPKNADYWYHASLAQTKTNKYKSALKSIEKAIQLNPYIPEYYYFKSNILFKKDDLSQAESDIRLFLTYFAHHEKATLLHARILLETNRLDQALEITRQLINDNKISDELYFIRGNIYQFKGLFDQAIQDYSMSLDLNPKEYTTYMNRGGCYLMLNEDDKACEDFNKALRLGYKNAYPLIRDYCSSKI
jgi:tetratricopeptide (TPR) repeat protein